MTDERETNPGTGVEFSEHAGIPIAYISGEVDVFNAPHIEASLQNFIQQAPKVVISFERCRYCDSSGISMLVRVFKRLRDGLAIVVPSGAQLRNVLTVTQIDQVIPVHETVEKATRSLT